MSILTTFFNLIKPAKTDGVKVSDFNANMDTIDTEMHRPPLTVNGIEPNSTTRDLYLEEVPLATNLSSDIAQLNTGLFIQRTTGGDASIDDGSAFLVSIRGNSVHTGQVAEEIDWQVIPAPREEGVDPITATFDRDTFVSYVQASGTITLTYTTAWSADPANYGFTVTGTPIAGDVITVDYVKEDRGTITVATPATFNSTGWNLYNYETGYAKVVAYEYGYRLGGTYSLIEFATTINGTRSAVTVTNGTFTVSEDGYIFITGGDETTYIYPYWTDWASGYEGDFQTYTVDTIDLTEVMLNFPYGLLAVGNVRDEINLNGMTAINRIERLAYSAENLATVIASGVAYECDTNYIYAVKEEATTTSIDIDGSYTVSDHGIEFYTGTSIPVYTDILYGENLKDKLRTDVLTISEQELTASQQAQVQKNLGLDEELSTKLVKVTDAGGLYCNAPTSSFLPLQSPQKNCGFGLRNAAGNNGAIMRVDFGDATNMTKNQVSFYEYSPKATADTGNSGHYEQYQLPAPDAGREANATYAIMTSKKHMRSLGTISSGSGNSVQVTFSEAGAFLFIVDSTTDTRMYFGLVHAASTNTPYVKDIYKGSNITVTTASGKVTFANSSSSGATVYLINLGNTGWTSTKV